RIRRASRAGAGFPFRGALPPRRGDFFLAVFRDDRNTRVALERGRRGRCGDGRAPGAFGLRRANAAVDRNGRFVLALCRHRLDLRLSLPVSDRTSMKRVQARPYLLTWIALLILLGLSAGSSLLPLGTFNLVSNFAIAALKAALVVVIFMRITRSAPIVY